MRLGCTRSECLRLALSTAALTASSRPFSAVAVEYNPGETPEDLAGALGGLKPGTGRPLNALIKFRAETGVERLVDTSPLFKAGQILDNLRTADGGVAEIAFSFPEAWTLAGGPNLDVRDVKQSDSAFVLVAKQPTKTPFEKVDDAFFLDVVRTPDSNPRPFALLEPRVLVSIEATTVC